MRELDPKQPVTLSYVALEARVPKDDPLRTIRRIVDQVLEDLSADFTRMYARTGRPSVPPWRMLRALLRRGQPQRMDVHGAYCTRCRCT